MNHDKQERARAQDDEQKKRDSEEKGKTAGKDTVPEDQLTRDDELMRPGSAGLLDEPGDPH